MGNYGKEKPVLVESFGPPTGTVDLGMAIDKDGNKITTAGVAVTAVADDDFAQSDIDSNTANPVNKLKIPGVTLGLCRVLLGGNATAGMTGSVRTDGKFQDATAGQVPAVVFREGGSAGDLVEAFKLPSMPKVGSATITALTDSSTGAASDTLAAMTGVDGTGSNAAPLTATKNAIASLAAKINAFRTALREQGIVL